MDGGIQLNPPLSHAVCHGDHQQMAAHETLVCHRSHCTQSHTRGADAKHFTLSHYEKRVVAGPHPDAGAVAASALSALATPEPFADSIYACLGNHTGTSGEVVLLIHGSNESWSHAIKKAAQLTWDTSQISPAAAEGLPGDSTPGRRIALAFDWASAGHGGTFTSHKDDRGINAAQDQLPVLLQILEELVSSSYVCCSDSGCRLLILPVVAECCMHVVLRQSLVWRIPVCASSWRQLIGHRHMPSSLTDGTPS